jgi:hypothetical protein
MEFDIWTVVEVREPLRELLHHNNEHGEACTL